MQTTLERIKSFGPCATGWDKLTRTLGRIKGKVTLAQILESNGIKDAIWALRCFHYKTYSLFLADICDLVSKHTKDEIVHDCIECVRLYTEGYVNYTTLSYAADAAYSAAYSASDAAADAAYSAAYSAAAYSAAYSVAAYVAAYSAADAAYSAADAARVEFWNKVQVLFIEYCC